MNRLFGYCLVISLCSKGYTTCSTKICFTWRVSQNSLTLICKVDDLTHKVLIRDPSDKIQGECFPPFRGAECIPYYRNITISQNTVTRETICKVKGDINDRLNGNWTCSHGTGRDVAAVEVTVMKNEDKNHTQESCEVCEHKNIANNQTTSDTSCIVHVMFPGIAFYLLSILVFVFLFSFVRCDIDVLKGLNKRSSCESFQSHKRAIVCMRIFFVAVTFLYFGSLALVGWRDNEPCISKYAAIVMSVFYGIITSVIFLQTKGTNSELSHKELGHQGTNAEFSHTETGDQEQPLNAPNVHEENESAV